MGLKVSIDSFDRKEFDAIEDLIQNAVVADVEDLGILTPNYPDAKPQHKVRLVYIVTEEDSEGRPKRAFERFTLSLHEKASLRKRVSDMGYTEEQLSVEGGFDLDILIGKKVKLILSKEDGKGANKGKIFVNVKAVMAVKRGEFAPDVPADFVRAKDREKK